MEKEKWSNFTRSPLGLFGLFVLFVYSIATLVMSLDGIEEANARVYALFIVLYPVLIVLIFAAVLFLRPNSLYAPSDYRSDETFLSLQLAILADRATNAGSYRTVPIAAQLRNTAARLDQLRRSLPDGMLGHVLWVDDKPENNELVCERVKALGIKVDVALSTEEAIEKTNNVRYSSLISDMGRPEGAQAGFELLKLLRERGSETPFYIYAGSRSPEHRRETLLRGGQGTTNSASELVRWIVGDAVSAAVWK